MLVLLLLVSGVFAGWALSMPIRSLNLNFDSAVQLDHRLLVSKLEPEDALVAQSDLNSRWQPGDPAIAGFGALGTSYCGETVSLDNAVGEPLARVFVDDANGATLISQVVRNRKLQDADAYMRDISAVFDDCDDEFFRVIDDQQVAVEVRDERGNAPVTEYITRTLVPTDAENITVVTYFQAGDEIIALTYVGPTRPEEGFLDGVERSILSRIDPAQFGATDEISGTEELPVDGVTKIDETGTTIEPIDDGQAPSPVEVDPSTTAGADG